MVSGGSFIEGAADGFMWGSIAGALSGGLGGTGLGTAWQVVGNEAISFGSYATQSAVNGEQITLIGSLFSIVGGITGGLMNNAKWLTAFFVELGFEGAGLILEIIKKYVSHDPRILTSGLFKKLELMQS